LTEDTGVALRETVDTGWLVWPAFFVVVLLGGSNAVAVRFSNLELPPFWGATLRFASAAVLFWAVVLIRRIDIPKGRALLGALVFGALSIGVSYAFLYWALVFVPASTTMVVLALGPLLTFFLAWAHGQESFRLSGLIGAVVAFTGILVAVGSQVGSSIPLLPILALVAAAAAIAEASVLFKFFPGSDPIAVNALALTIGAAILLVISLITKETWSLPSARATWTAYAYLVLGGSGVLFYLYLYILERWTASATSYGFLLFPVATVFIASWLADEVISPRFAVGGVIVLVGVWVGAMMQPTPADADAL
jgi:drug/metabolite transporter (DMT)-like permease